MIGPASTGAEAHVFVEDVHVPVLDEQDRHHLARVLRLRPGALVTVADGHGAWRPVRFAVELVPDGPVVHDPAPAPELAVAFALVKGDRPELVVQKLTELGMDRIVPMHTDRCVVHWEGERALRHHERLVKVAREAAMQCRRSRLPVVEPVQPFSAVIVRPSVALAAGGGVPPTLAHRLLLVGPEGGWSPSETVAAPAVALGPYVMRAETAALVAGALLAALRADLVHAGPAPGHVA